MTRIYKSICNYGTENGEFSVQFIGSLSDNLNKIDNHLKNLRVVHASGTHTDITQDFFNIVNERRNEL